MIHLPEEVLNHIFYFLPENERLTNVNLACKMFYKVSKKYCFEFNPCTKITDEQLKLSLETFPNIKSISLVECENISCPIILQPNLTFLSIYFTDFDIEKLEELIQRSKYLKKLHLDGKNKFTYH